MVEDKTGISQRKNIVYSSMIYTACPCGVAGGLVHISSDQRAR